MKLAVLAPAIERLETRQLLAAAVSGTEVLANFHQAHGLNAIQSFLQTHASDPLAKAIDLKHSKELFTSGKLSTVQVRIQKGSNSATAIKLLKKVPTLQWASPNYLYTAPKSEFTPNDPQWPSQVDPLVKLQLQQAWDVTKGSSSVTVAVLDQGIDTTVTDLAGAIWTNVGEIAGNGIDDDHNGYVDDVHGYDFGSNDADPSPAFNPDYQLTDSHGTQVASVIGSTMDNGAQIAGVAGGGVKIMPVRFYGYGVVTSSAGLASSIAYAANNGAKIINISFSIDPYMNDPAFTAATDLAYSKGCLWLNSSGNSNVKDPPRGQITKALFIDNVDPTDTKYVDSNYGFTTDLSAPGVEVVSIAPGNDVYPSTGTSFSTAVTSGIAALIWSAHPTWTRDQVAAQLIGTSDNIDALNPAYASQLGAGRVNAFKAVSQTIGAPKLRGLVGVASGATLTTGPTTISLSLLNVLNPTSVTGSAFELRSAGVDGAFNTADDVIVPITLSNTYAYGTNTLDFTLAQPLANGKYRFTAKQTIVDPFGVALDGDSNGTAGGNYVSDFTVTTGAPVAPTGLTATLSATTSTQAVLKWTDTATDFTGFVIERSTSATFATIDRSFTADKTWTQYTDWGLSMGTTYYYRIRATNTVGASPNSNVATIAVPLPPPGVPNAPAGFTGAASTFSTTEIDLKWTDKSNNETSFLIQRSTSSTFATIDKTLTGAADTVQYSDWGLTNPGTYYYRMAAVNGADQSAFTPVITVKLGVVVPPVAPAAPDKFDAKPGTGSGAVNLSWRDNSTNETSFVIQRSIFSTFFIVDKTITVAANATSATDTVQFSHVKYYYRVYAVNSAGASDYSKSASITL